MQVLVEMNKNEIVKRPDHVVHYGLGEYDCEECGAKMSVVKLSTTSRAYLGRKFTFDGFGCTKCGHLKIVQR